MDLRLRVCGLSAQTFSSAYERAGEVFYAVQNIAGFTSHLSVMRAKRGLMVDGAALGRVRSGAVGDALGGEFRPWRVVCFDSVEMIPHESFPERLYLR